jgi:hypothetical protein
MAAGHRPYDTSVAGACAPAAQADGRSHAIAFGDLGEMKRAAGRPKDLLDLDELGKIHGDQS